jgi:hypothetical protein
MRCTRFAISSLHGRHYFIEYCSSILFLTANRVEELEEAILSRIHPMLRYKELDKRDRKEGWRNSLGRANTIRGPSKLKENEMDCLVSAELSPSILQCVPLDGEL